MTTTRETVDRLARQTEDAYSYGRYPSWKAVIAMLLRRGYSEREVEAILRSKWTRWAADQSDRPYGRVPAQALIDFIDDPRNRCTREAVAELVRGTF